MSLGSKKLTMLDALSKDEKEALLSAKMEKIRRQNEAIQKRHAEILADKQQAEANKCSVTVQPKPAAVPPKQYAVPPATMVGDQPPAENARVNDERLPAGGRGRGRWDQQQKQQPNAQGRGRSSRLSTGDDGPPPDPSNNFLADSMRDVNNSRSNPSQPQRHPRNYGGDSFSSVQKQEFRGPSHAPTSDMEMSMRMTGRQRREYQEWKEEREAVEKSRLARAHNSEGQWRREWDLQKDDSNFSAPPVSQNRTRPAARPVGRIGSGRFAAKDDEHHAPKDESDEAPAPRGRGRAGGRNRRQQQQNEGSVGRGRGRGRLRKAEPESKIPEKEAQPKAKSGSVRFNLSDTVHDVDHTAVTSEEHGDSTPAVVEEIISTSSTAPPLADTEPSFAAAEEDNEADIRPGDEAVSNIPEVAEDDDSWETEDEEDSEFYDVEDTSDALKDSGAHNSSAESLERFIEENTLRLDVEAASLKRDEALLSPPESADVTSSPISPISPMKTPEGHVNVTDWAAAVDSDVSPEQQNPKVVEELFTDPPTPEAVAKVD